VGNFHNRASFAQAEAGRTIIPQREEKKALSPLSKAEHLRRRRGFYPLSILCLIRSAKITASAMIECGPQTAWYFPG
jgi:hypothetical protein